MNKIFSQEQRTKIKDFFKKKALTKTEILVFIEVIAGKSNQEISKELSVSEKCIRWHLTNIYKKTKTKRRSQLIWLLDDSLIICL